MPKQIQIGDIIEIRTAKGLAYAQYTHQHPQMGGLICVFDKIFENRPNDLFELVNGPLRFSTFIPVRAAVNRGIFKVISRQEIAGHNKPFPLFRNGVPDRKTKKVSVWWLWDGEKSWIVGELTAAQRKLPLRQIWNDTLLIERIESGWTPSTE